MLVFSLFIATKFIHFFWLISSIKRHERPVQMQHAFSLSLSLAQHMSTQINGLTFRSNAPHNTGYLNDSADSILSFLITFLRFSFLYIDIFGTKIANTFFLIISSETKQSNTDSNRIGKGIRNPISANFSLNLAHFFVTNKEH